MSVMGIKRVVNKKGFTLIEMIGVLAVIAILAAFIAPKVFKVIKESKPAKFAAQTRTYSTAIVDWYKDIGTLQSIAAGGGLNATDASFQVELMTKGANSGGSWVNWNGPYIESVSGVAIGTTLTIATIPCTVGSSTAASDTEGMSFDFDGDGNNDMSGQQVVTIQVTGVTQVDFDAVNGIIDKGIANEDHGKVKYDAAGDVLYLYLASE